MKILPNKVNSAIQRHLLSWCHNSTIDGISISDLRGDDGNFDSIVNQALALIKKHDKRRYVRVTNELDWIVNSNDPEPNNGAFYRHITKGCYINFKNDFDDQFLFIALIAARIVHEATHGYLCTKGINYETDLRVRIERLCCSEENRFLSIIENNYPEYMGQLTFEFNPKDWDKSWNTSRKRKLLNSLKRQYREFNS